MGAYGSVAKISQSVLDDYKKKNIIQVGTALQKFSSIYGFSVVSLGVEDYNDIFFSMWRKEGTKYFKQFKLKQVGVLEVFSVSYLLADADMIPFEQKLDAILSLYQFNPLPESVDLKFSYIEPNQMVHRDQLNLMLECTVLGLCQLSHLKNPIPRVYITDIVNSLFGEAPQLPWRQVKNDICIRGDVITFLEPLLGLVHLPALMEEVNAQMVVMSKEFEALADPYKLLSSLNPRESADSGVAQLSSSLMLKISQCAHLLTSHSGPTTLSQSVSAGKSVEIYSTEEVEHLHVILHRVSTDDEWIDAALFSRIARSLIAFNCLAAHSSLLLLPPSSFGSLSKLSSPTLAVSSRSDMGRGSAAASPLEEEDTDQHTMRIILRFMREHYSYNNSSRHRSSAGPSNVDEANRKTNGSNQQQSQNNEQQRMTRMLWVDFRAHQMYKTLRMADSQIQEEFLRLTETQCCADPAAAAVTLPSDTPVVTSGSESSKKALGVGIHIRQIPDLVRNLLGAEVLSIVRNNLSAGSRRLAQEHITFVEEWLESACPHNSNTGLIKWHDLLNCHEELSRQISGLREYVVHLQTAVS